MTTKTPKATKATPTNVTPSIEELLRSKADLGWTKKKIEAFLILEDFTPARIKKAFESAGLVHAKPVTFASEYYDWLAVEARTVEEATAYILGTGEFGDTSANVQKHKSHYLGIHGLSVAVWGAK